MNTEPSNNRCPKCGADVPAEAPQGLCPKCVLLGAATGTEASEPERKRIEPPPLALVATAFPQLEIIELIGHGGMGLVYKARQPRLDRFVALKLLPEIAGKDPAFAERFNREARVLARLNHPNIVTVFDFGQAGGFFYLLMELVDGVNLRQAMRAGKFSAAEALNIVPKICDALQFAHSEGILHRDIKPENILLDSRGRVKIADFGIAKLVGDTAPDITLTASGAALGTPHYMAPEQLEKPQTVDHRADIYSLGVVFYEMLTGELPLGRFAPPSAKTSLDDRVDEIVLRALAKERELRQQSAGQMKTEVETVASHPNIPPPIVSSPSAASMPREQKSLDTRPAPAWIRRVGFLFLVLGGIAFLPTLFTLGSNTKIYHSGMLLTITGIALLTRNKTWRSAALTANLLGLILPVVSFLAIARHAGTGTLPLGWSFGVPGISNSGGLAVVLWMFEIAAFVAGIRALTRADAKAAFGLSAHSGPPPVLPSSNISPRRSQLAVGAAGLLLFSLIAAVPLLFLASFAAMRSNGQAVSGGAPALMVILFVLVPGVLGTILGAIAAWRVTRDAKSNGLGLALFAALAWPVLLVNTLASRIIMMLIAPTTENPVELWSAVIFVSVGLLAVDAFCVAMIWRTLHRRVVRAGTANRHTPGFAKIATLTALLLALPVFALSVLNLVVAKRNLDLATQPPNSLTFTNKLRVLPESGSRQWQPTPMENPVSDSQPALVLKVADVDVNQQFLLVTLVSEAGWPAHELRVNFYGPALDTSPALPVGLNADCALEPRRAMNSTSEAMTNGLLAGKKSFPGPATVKLAFALPDETLAQAAFDQAVNILLNKPVALKTSRTLALFTLGREVGFNDQGEPQREVLQATVSVFPVETSSSNVPDAPPAISGTAALNNPSTAPNSDATTRKQDIQIRLARENLAEQRKKFEVGAASPLDVAKSERDLTVAEARGDAVKIAEANLKFAELNFENARRQFSVGKLTSADLRTIEAERDIAKVELEEAQAKAKTSVSASSAAAVDLSTKRVAALQLEQARQKLAELRKQVEVGQLAPQGREILETEAAVAIAEAAVSGDALLVRKVRFEHAGKMLNLVRKLHEVGKATAGELRLANTDYAEAQIQFEENSNSTRGAGANHLDQAIYQAQMGNPRSALDGINNALPFARVESTNRWFIQGGVAGGIANAHIFSGNLDARLTALAAHLAATVGDRAKLEEALEHGRTIWPASGEWPIYEIWENRFSGIERQPVRYILTTTADLNELKSGDKRGLKVTVERWTRTSTNPPTRVEMDRGWFR